MFQAPGSAPAPSMPQQQGGDVACAKRGVKVVLGGPYNSGMLAGGMTFNYENASREVMARADAMKV